MAEALKPINGSGLQLTPFNTHKRWTVTDANFRTDYYQMSILKGISPEFNEKILISGSLGLPSTQLTNSGSNSTPFLKAKYQKVIYSGVNQMFFKHRTNIERDLYVSASIFSIPHNRMGDGIKPGTISNVDYSISSSNISTPLTITDSKLDEYHGYLIDSDLNTGSYVPFGDLMGYWGFNDEVIPRVVSFDSKIQDRSGYAHHAVGKNVEYTNGITTTGFVSQSSGTKVTFNGTDSYIKVNHNKQLDFFKDSDYAISVWVVLPTSQSDASADRNSIISKNGTYREYVVDASGVEVVRVRNIETPIYPFDLRVANQTLGNKNGCVFASISDGISVLEITSSTTLNDATPHHIVFNKIGSLTELYIDGVKEASSSIATSYQISNTYDMLFGSKFDTDTTWDVTSDFQTLSGSLDEVRIYRKGLTQAQISGLSNNDYVTGSAYQSNVIGEVFYKHGIMVVSDPRPLYKNVWVGNDNWAYGDNYGFTTKYKSTKQLHEIALLCEIGANEFNISQNPSLKVNNDINSEFLQGFTTGSDFSPYYTTIGLYNPDAELIAIAKLASPIKNRDDVDITIKVRLDLDGAFGAAGIGELPPDRGSTLHIQSDGNSVWNSVGTINNQSPAITDDGSSTTDK